MTTFDASRALAEASKLLRSTLYVQQRRTIELAKILDAFDGAKRYKRQANSCFSREAVFYLVSKLEESQTSPSIRSGTKQRSCYHAGLAQP